MTAAAMTPGWHAERMPDAPAIITGLSGDTVTYAQLEERSVRFARVLRSRGVGVGDHIAILMENNSRYLGVAWASQRSGLFYTAINTHLRAGEVQYVLDDCGAVALVASEAMADLVAGLDLSRIGIRVSALGELSGFESYDDLLASEAPDRLDDECEGREMLYSSGTTGRPKGVRKQLPGTHLEDATAAPVQIAKGLGALGGGRGSVYLSPGPLVSRSAARLVNIDTSFGRNGSGNGALRSPPVPRANPAPPSDTGAVRANDVCPYAAPSHRGARTLRLVEPAACGPCRRSVPGRGETPDARQPRFRQIPGRNGPGHPRLEAESLVAG